MKKLLVLVALLPCTAFAAPCPSAGPLQIKNNLAEIGCYGSDAQAAARANLGLSGTPLAVPTAPFLAGSGGALTAGTVGVGLSYSAGTLAVVYGTTLQTALQGSLYGASNGVATLSGGLVPLSEMPTGTSGAVIPLLNSVNTWSGAQTFSAGLTGTVTGHSTLDLALTGIPSASLLGGTGSSLAGVSVGAGLSLTDSALAVSYGTTSGTAAQGNDSRIVGALQTSGGTMSGALHMGAQTLDGSAAAFTGGTLSGLTISGSPISGSTGAFTTLGASGAVTLSGTGTGLAVTHDATVGGEADFGTASQAYFQVFGGTTAGGPVLQLGGTAVTSSTPMTITAGAGGPVRLTGNSALVQVWQSQLQLVPNATWSGTNGFAQSGLFMSANNVGTYTGTAITYDAYLSGTWNMNVGTSAGNTGLTLGVHADVGGTSMTGNAGAFGSTLTITAPTLNATGAGGTYVSAYAAAYANVNDNGTLGAEKGQLFAFNTVASLGASAAHWNSVVSYEADTDVAIGATVSTKLGIQIVDTLPGGAAGSADDQALSINNQYQQGSGGVGWKYGISFGRLGGYFPMASAGTMIGAVGNVGGDTMNSAYGIDFSAVTFSTAFLKSTGFLVDGSGNLTAASYKAGSTAGVTCSGSPTSSFAATGGIVTHC